MEEAKLANPPLFGWPVVRLVRWQLAIKALFTQVAIAFDGSWHPISRPTDQLARGGILFLLRCQHPAVNLNRPDAELSFKLQRLLQPIKNVFEYLHRTQSSNLKSNNSPVRYLPLYPNGFMLCHFHVSAHISSMPRFAVHLSSFFASAGSAQHSAMSPGRRGWIL